MELRPLGATDLRVSAICLGTMTWGRQNTEAEGHAQMDYALERGITFWDTAEMYATPPTAETYGRTEEIIGSWLARRGGRDRIVLATKVIGPPRPGGFSWVRGGQTRHNREHITAALDASLKRLGTDYVDLYQLHWPDRATPRFGDRSYNHRPEADGAPVPETLGVLADLIKAGKIRHVGLSNETPWGAMTFLKHAEIAGLPRMVSIQNAYNLLNRTFEDGLAEVALREQCGLLAYSPLGGGTLTGKYLGGARPPGSRRAIDPRGSRYVTVNAEAATEAYVALARQHGLDPAQMAIAFALGRPFVTSVIIGATSMAQLKTDIGSAEVTLSDQVIAGIEEIHGRLPNPCP